MGLRSKLLSLAIVVGCLMAALGTDADAAGLHGVIVIDSVHLQTIHGVSQYQIDPTILSNSSVGGVSIRMFWGDVEPSDGTFVWTTLDSLISQAAAAGKFVVIRVMPGWAAPAWLYAEGARPFNFVWYESNWGPAFCSIATTPVPWDPIFVSKWTALIQAMGAHYDGNPAVAAVKITGINSADEETNLPASSGQPISNGSTSCTSNNDVLNWQEIGYTRTLAESTWLQFAQAWQQAFPREQIEAVMQPGGFPPIDGSGNIISTQSGFDNLAPQDIITSGVANFGSQFVVQNDALTNQWIWSFEEGYADQITTGYQTYSALGESLQGATLLAVNGNSSYMELYEADIQNPLLYGLVWLINRLMQFQPSVSATATLDEALSQN